MVLLSFATAENVTINKTNEENTTINKTDKGNIIDQFIQQDIQSNFLKFIGLPESIRLDHFIIYIMILCGIILMVYDTLNITGFIEKKLINFGIATIIILLGTINQTAYRLIQPIYNFEELFEKISGIKGISIVITIGTIVGIFYLFKLLKKIVLNMKQAAENEKGEIRKEKLETLSKIQDIQMMGAGIDPHN